MWSAWVSGDLEDMKSDDAWPLSLGFLHLLLSFLPPLSLLTYFLHSPLPPTLILFSSLCCSPSISLITYLSPLHSSPLLFSPSISPFTHLPLLTSSPLPPQLPFRMLMTSCARSSMTLSRLSPRAQTECWQCTTSQVTLSNIILAYLIEAFYTPYLAVLKRIRASLFLLSLTLCRKINGVHLLAWYVVVFHVVNELWQLRLKDLYIFITPIFHGESYFCASLLLHLFWAFLFNNIIPIESIT